MVLRSMEFILNAITVSGYFFDLEIEADHNLVYIEVPLYVIGISTSLTTKYMNTNANLTHLLTKNFL